MASGRLLLFLCAFVVIAAAAPNATLLVLSTKYFSSPERKPGALHELDLSSGAVTRSTHLVFPTRHCDPPPAACWLLQNNGYDFAVSPDGAA